MDSSAERALDTRRERTLARIERAERVQRVRAGCVAILVGLIGAGIAVDAGALTTTVAGAVAAVAGGLGLLGLAVLLMTTRALRVGGQARTRQVWADAGPAFEVRLKRFVPWGRLLVGGAGAVWLAAGAVALGGGGYVLMVPAVLLALLVPDALIALGRRPVLRFDALGISYDGWTARASVRWEDVERVELERQTVWTSQPRVMVAVASDAPSFQASWRRIVLPVDRRPKAPGFGVPMAALDEPEAVEIVLAGLLKLPSDKRGGYLEYPATVDALTGGRGLSDPARSR